VNEELTANEDDSPLSFLDCAERIAQTIESLDRRSEVIALIALKHAEAGHLEIAAEVAEAIDDSYRRDQTLARITATCVKAGAADFAEQLIEMISDETAHAQAIEEMALAYAESGEFERSIEVAHELDDSAPTLSRIALACLTGGQTAEALEVTRSIDYAEVRTPVLVELAAHTPDGEDTEELLAEASASAEEIEFFEQRLSALIAIAAVHKKRGSEDRALEVLTHVHQLIEESEDRLAKDPALAQIAIALAELHRFDQADQMIEEIENPFHFANATAGVALEYHKAGDSTNASTLLAEALEIVRNEEVYGQESLLMREGMLDELARYYAIAGHYEEALQVAGLIESENQRHRSLGGIAKLCVSSGNNNRAFQTAELIEDKFARVLCEIGLVDAFIKAEQLELADHALGEAFARTATIEQTYQKVLAMMEVAQRFARREQAAKASEVLFEGLATAVSIDSNYLLSQALIGLADKYYELGQQPGQKEQQVLEEILHKLDL
jgi:tetratricopeptide (TPR) repeat protein